MIATHALMSEKRGSTTTKFLGMSSNRERRVRGGPAIALNTRVAPAAKATIDTVADALGKSQGQAIDLIFQHVQVDEQGNVTINSGILVARDDQEELPLRNTA